MARGKRPDHQVPVDSGRLNAALELRGMTGYELAKRLEPGRGFNAMKESIRVILAGKVATTGLWRLEAISEALRVPIRWLQPADPSLPIPTSPEEAAWDESLAPIAEWSLARWDLLNSLRQAFMTRLEEGMDPSDTDPGDEVAMLAGLREWLFVGGPLNQLINARRWRDRLLVGTEEELAERNGDLGRATAHLVEAFRVILAPFLTYPSVKVDLLAMSHAGSATRAEARAAALVENPELARQLQAKRATVGASKKH